MRFLFYLFLTEGEAQVSKNDLELYTAENDLELLILLPLHPKLWDVGMQRYMWFCVVVRMEPKGFMHLGQALYQLSYISNCDNETPVCVCKM